MRANIRVTDNINFYRILEEIIMADKWILTDYPEIIFEDSKVGRMKKELWDASDEEIEKILEEYGIPAPSELGKPGCYIQNTSRNKAFYRIFRFK